MIFLKIYLWAGPIIAAAFMLYEYARRGLRWALGRILPRASQPFWVCYRGPEDGKVWVLWAFAIVTCIPVANFYVLYILTIGSWLNEARWKRERLAREQAASAAEILADRVDGIARPSQGRSGEGYAVFSFSKAQIRKLFPDMKGEIEMRKAADAFAEAINPAANYDGPGHVIPITLDSDSSDAARWKSGQPLKTIDSIMTYYEER